MKTAWVSLLYVAPRFPMACYEMHCSTLLPWGACCGQDLHTTRQGFRIWTNTPSVQVTGCKLNWTEHVKESHNWQWFLSPSMTKMDYNEQRHGRVYNLSSSTISMGPSLSDFEELRNQKVHCNLIVFSWNVTDCIQKHKQLFSNGGILKMRTQKFPSWCLN